MSIKNKATFSREPFPKIRKATIGVLSAAKRKNMIHSFIEVDVTDARNNLRAARRNTKNYLSFLGYIIYCVSKEVDNNKKMHAYRNRKNQLILFDDIDVSITIERKINNRREVVPMILRGTNHRTINEISTEIKGEKSQDSKETEVFNSMNLFLLIPGFIRQFIFKLIDKSPQIMKKKAGTVMVTSASMVGRGAAWGLPIATHTLNVTIGGIVDRILEKNGKFEKREHLCLTLSFDHDIIDGAPAARFIRNLKRTIENGNIEE